jgi:hypothetical protein
MDTFGCHIDYLRVSVTDRCNERCVYCMPRGYKGWAERADHLTADEMMTGAPLPLGADCIVPAEEISRTGKIILVSPDFEVIPRRYVHAAGSDAREGGRLLELGILLGLRDDPAESAVAVRFALEESDSVIISGAASKGGGETSCRRCSTRLCDSLTTEHDRLRTAIMLATEHLNSESKNHRKNRACRVVEHSDSGHTNQKASPKRPAGSALPSLTQTDADQWIKSEEKSFPR